MESTAMWRSLFLSLLSALLLLQPTAGAPHNNTAKGVFVGDVCVAAGGGAGLCRKLSNCPEAKEALLNGKEPSHCSHEGFSPIVCCPESRKAVRMCTKYAEAVFVYEKSFHLPPQIVRLDRCAIKGIPFIAHGEKAAINEFPHMALISYSESRSDPVWGCGGSLISERFVLTAGHCLKTTKGVPRWLRLGELDLTKTTEQKHEDFAVAEPIPHPDYVPGVHYNDIGLLRLERGVTFNPTIRPACLYVLPEVEDTKAIATGWGYTDWVNPVISDHLMKVKLQFQKTEICNTSYENISGTDKLRSGIVDNSMVCAGETENGQDTCKGDSGGPLQVPLKSPYCMYSVVGVTSFGKTACGVTNSPAIYTRVSRFLPWIESVAWPGES